MEENIFGLEFKCILSFFSLIFLFGVIVNEVYGERIMKNFLELLIYGIDYFVQEEKRKEERGGNGREGRREGEEGREEQFEFVVCLILYKWVLVGGIRSGKDEERFRKWVFYS